MSGHIIIAKVTFSGNYHPAVIQITISRQRRSLREKELSLIALSLFAALPAAASQQSDSQGFIDDSHLDLFLRNAYISRDYHQGQQDKAEWGQGIIATFASGYTEGLVGFGVDGIAQYGVRLDGGRGKSGAGGIDFFKQEEDGRAKSDLAKFGATAKMRISNTVLSYGNQRPELPVINADSSRLLFESYTGTMLTSKRSTVWKSTPVTSPTSSVKAMTATTAG